MAESFKVLGQSIPAATTLTDLYTVPALTSAVVSSITVANQSGVATSFRISIAPAGAADVTSQYIAFDVAILGNAVATFVLGIGLATTDKIRVRATLATLSFSAFGVEIT